MCVHVCVCARVCVHRTTTAMLDFGCGTGSHSHFQFVTVSQTAAGQRLARTPLAGPEIASRFNKLLVIYISAAAAAVICLPSTRTAPEHGFTLAHLPPSPRDPLRADRRDDRRYRQVLTPGGGIRNAATYV